VFLGITDTYFEAVMHRLEALHPSSFERLEPTSARAAGVVWTFVQHPSPLSINHYRRWVGTDDSVKRDAARRAVGLAFGFEPEPVEETGRVLPRAATAAPPTRRVPAKEGSATAQAVRAMLNCDPDIARRGR
jgi:hypothetical protein